MSGELGSSGEKAQGTGRLPPLTAFGGGRREDESITPKGAGRASGETAAGPAPNSTERAARDRKLAADLRGTRDDFRTSSSVSGHGETVSVVLVRAAVHFERGEQAQGADLAAAARAALSRGAVNARGHAEVHEANTRRYEGTPFADLAHDDAREARENAARLSWQAHRVRQLAAPPGSETAGTVGPREVAQGTGPLAGAAAAVRQLAADVRKSPVRGTYYSDQNFPDRVPADTRYMASTELELAAARFDQGNEPQGRMHLAGARRILHSRYAAARHGRWGGWERLNDEPPNPEDFQAEAFHHANRAGLIEDDLTAAQPSAQAEVARISRAVETAWNLGTGHRLAGSTSSSYAESPEGRALLAAALGLPGGGHDPAARNAANAYADAFDLAGRMLEDPDAARYPGYLEGQQVVTALGRTGVLTGESEALGYPFVRFGDGPAVPVPRSVITGPVTHVCDDAEDAHALAQSRPDLAEEGDTVRVRFPEQVFAVMAGPVHLASGAGRQDAVGQVRNTTVSGLAGGLNWVSAGVRPAAPARRQRKGPPAGQVVPPSRGNPSHKSP